MLRAKSFKILFRCSFFIIILHFQSVEVSLDFRVRLRSEKSLKSESNLNI